MGRKRRSSSLQTFRCPESLLLLVANHFGHLTGWLFWELQILVESVMNRLSRNVMALSEFPDTLHFSGEENRWYGHSHQGLVMVDLLDNFLNSLQLFLAVTNDFPKSPWRRFAGGSERMMNGGLATANQVRDREKGLKQKFLGIESAVEDIL